MRFTKNFLTKRIPAFLLILALILPVLIPQGAFSASAVTTHETAPPMHKKILVLDFDPMMPSRGNVKMSQYLYNLIKYAPDMIKPPQESAPKFGDLLNEASHGILNYTFTYEYVNEFPKMTTGFQYTDEQFAEACEAAWSTGRTPWNYFESAESPVTGYRFNYEYFIEKLNLLERKNSGEFDEIWMYSEMASAFETVMVGRGAYWINGRSIEADCGLFRINYIAKHRLDTPLENLGHSAEWLLTHVYNGKGKFENVIPIEERNTWEKFMQVDKHFPGDAAVGNVHYAPNSQSDYQWNDKTEVYSTWQDWRDNYPNLTGEKKLSNSNDWGNGNNLTHKAWWFSCFPHVTGRDEEGYSHNWWIYYQNFVHTSQLELYINGTKISNSFPITQGQTYDLKVMATLTDRTVIDVTDDCVIESNSDYSIDTSAKKLTALKSSDVADISVWRDGKNLKTFDWRGWIASESEWSIAGDTLSVNGVRNSIAMRNTPSAGDFTYELTVNMPVAGGAGSGAGPMWRMASDNSWTTGYFLGLNPENGSVMLFSLGKTIASNPSYGIKANHNYNIKIEMLGENIKVYIDGELLFDVNDNNVNVPAEGMFGFRTYYQPVEISAVNVKLPDPEVIFEDAIFENYIREQIGKPAGTVYASDVSGITVVDVLGKGIQSLKGIEYMTSLVYLSCGDNELTTIDVSKNTLLEDLSCGNNKLTTLDVSKNTLLKELSCHDNELTVLDVTKNTALTYIDCYKNKLDELDLSENTALKYLWCYENNLTTLDLSKNTALTSLYCADNALTVLDVSKNAALTALYCSDNALTVLDVSENAKLMYLSCGGNKLTAIDVSENTDLRILSCDHNELTVLDVTKNTELYYIKCSYNKLIGIDTTNNSKLTTLIYDPQFPDITQDPEVVFEDAIFENYIREQIGKPTGTIYASDVSGITEINVDNMGIQSLKGIEYMTSLTRLSCDYNNLTTLDVSKNTVLTTLNCGMNQLTALDVSENTALTFLGCYYNNLVELDVSKNTSLGLLYCHNNQLTTLDVSKNTALTDLSCSDNQLTALDVSKNTALTVLFCGSNQLTTLDVSENIALARLNCRSNQLTVLDVSKNTELWLLSCSYNKLRNIDTTNNTKLTHYLEFDPQFPDVIIGDLDGDGMVDAKDLITLRDFILKISQLAAEEMPAADVNGDGKVNLADIMSLRKIILS